MISHALDISFGPVFSKISSIGETEEIPNHRAAFPQLCMSGTSFPAIHLSSAAGATLKLDTGSENRNAYPCPQYSLSSI